MALGHLLQLLLLAMLSLGGSVSAAFGHSSSGNSHIIDAGSSPAAHLLGVQVQLRHQLDQISWK